MAQCVSKKSKIRAVISKMRYLCSFCATECRAKSEVNVVWVPVAAPSFDSCVALVHCHISESLMLSHCIRLCRVNRCESLVTGPGREKVLEKSQPLYWLITAAAAFFQPWVPAHFIHCPLLFCLPNVSSHHLRRDSD